MTKATALFAKLMTRQFRRARLAPRKPSQRVSPLLESLENRTLLSGIHTNGVHVLTNEHTDLDVTYATDDGMLHLAENNKSVNPIEYYPPDQVILEFLPGAQRPQTSDPRFAFTGVAPGDPIWVVPISPRDPNLLQLGVSAERIDDGVLGDYVETDPRLNGIDIPFPWVTLSVVDVRGPGFFSVWQINEDRSPTVWVATAGNPNPDLFFTFPSGHVDYDWAFSAPGNYEVDIVASAYLPDLTPIYSDVTTYHFQVDDTGAPHGGAPGQEHSKAGGLQALPMAADVTLLPNQLVTPHTLAAQPVTLSPFAASVTLSQAAPNPWDSDLSHAALSDQVFANLGTDQVSALTGRTVRTPDSQGLGLETPVIDPVLAPISQTV